jgi:hypothetical protein
MLLCSDLEIMDGKDYTDNKEYLNSIYLSVNGSDDGNIRPSQSPKLPPKADGSQVVGEPPVQPSTSKLPAGSPKPDDAFHQKFLRMAAYLSQEYPELPENQRESPAPYTDLREAAAPSDENIDVSKGEPSSTGNINKPSPVKKEPISYDDGKSLPSRPEDRSNSTNPENQPGRPSQRYGYYDINKIPSKFWPYIREFPQFLTCGHDPGNLEKVDLFEETTDEVKFKVENIPCGLNPKHSVLDCNSFHYHLCDDCGGYICNDCYKEENADLSGVENDPSVTDSDSDFNKDYSDLDSKESSPYPNNNNNPSDKNNSNLSDLDKKNSDNPNLTSIGDRSDINKPETKSQSDISGGNVKDSGKVNPEVSKKRSFDDMNTDSSKEKISKKRSFDDMNTDSSKERISRKRSFDNMNDDSGYTKNRDYPNKKPRK